MLNLRTISAMFNTRVYTDMGEYFGNVDEAILQNNKIFGWKIKSTGGSFLNRTISGAKGVIVPHQLVKATGDVMIISKAAIPSGEVEETTQE